MLEVHLRGQVRALCIVIVLCDLYGNNFYSVDEIIDLLNKSNQKITRSLILNEQYLRDSVQNEEIKLVLAEVLKNVIEFDRKKQGTIGSESNPFRIVQRMRYNMKHSEIINHICFELHKICDDDLSLICSQEEIKFFGKEVLVLNFSDSEIVTILSTQVSLLILKRRQVAELKRIEGIVNAPRPRRTPSPMLAEVNIEEQETSAQRWEYNSDVSVNSKNSSNRVSSGKFGSSSTIPTNSSLGLPPKLPAQSSRKRTLESCLKDYNESEVDIAVKKVLRSKGFKDDDIIDRLIDGSYSKSTKTRSFVSEIVSLELESQVSLTTAELEVKLLKSEHKLLEKSLEIKNLKMQILRMNESRLLQDADRTDIETKGSYIYIYNRINCNKKILVLIL